MEHPTELTDPPPPPREVPLSKAASYSWIGVLLGLVLVLDGLVIGGVFAFVNGPDYFGFQDQSLDGRGKTARAMVVDEASYEFQVEGGAKYTGRLFAGRLVEGEGKALEGGEIEIEYLPEDPNVSRPKGWRLAIFPSWVFLLLSVFPVGGLALALVYWRRIQSRRRIQTFGQAVQGEVLSISTKPMFNPTPVIIRFRAQDPITGIQVEDRHWLRASRVRATDEESSLRCWVAFDEDGSAKAALLAFPGWQAWRQ